MNPYCLELFCRHDHQGWKSSFFFQHGYSCFIFFLAFRWREKSKQFSGSKWIRVSWSYQLSFPEVFPIPNYLIKAQTGHQIGSECAECRWETCWRGRPSLWSSGSVSRIGVLLSSDFGVGEQRRSKSMWRRTCSLISVETRGGCAERSVPRP